MKAILAILTAVLIFPAWNSTAQSPLRDVHRIVFLGDSITQKGDYVTDIECWLISQGINIEVLNLGLSSETGTELTTEENAETVKVHKFARPCISERLDRILSAAKPDLVVACYGMNDGCDLPSDETGTKRFAQAITRLRDTALKAGAKHVVICTPPVRDSRNKKFAWEEKISRYSDWIMSKKPEHWAIVDIHGPMRRAIDQGRVKDPRFTFAGDGVHPNREGHWLMAREILMQFLGANLDGKASAEQMFSSKGDAIRKLVSERGETLRSAWMTKIGHKRPGVTGGPGARPGSSVEEANKRAAEISKEIAAMIGGTEPKCGKNSTNSLQGSAQVMPQPPADVQSVGGWTLEQEWKAAHVLPSARQVAWQRQGFIAFICFGVNTYTDREWGKGDEDPAIFNPVKLDARQWVKALKAAGVRQVLPTAKHHDGFCLWPSRFTEHSVKNSSWKGGKGDVLRELADACREEGLKLSIYLSPADLNAIKRGVYGKTEVKHRVIPTPVPGWTPKSGFRMEGEWDEYNTYFMNQMFELLTEYGPIHEVWFDGANPKDVGQQYAVDDWRRLIRALAPEAVILDGCDLKFGSQNSPDVRWIGNEGGKGRSNEWSVLTADNIQRFSVSDLGSRKVLKEVTAFRWYPAETDVSIRRGWYYHPYQDLALHSLETLLMMWYGAAGGNSVLLLSLPPNKEGLLCPGDVARLKELGQVLQMTFGTNLVAGATVKADSVISGYEAALALDGRDDTCWRTREWQRTGTVEFTLPQKRRFNVVDLKEDITHFGQRVENHAVEIWDSAQWKSVATAGTIGARRLHRLGEPVETDRVRVRFLESRVCPTLAEFGLYLEPKRLIAPEISRNRAGMVTLKASKGARIYYTTDGTMPTAQSMLYTQPFNMSGGGVVKATAEGDPSYLKFGDLLTVEEFGPAKGGWKIISVSSETETGKFSKKMLMKADYAIDDDPRTEWESKWQKKPDLPTLAVDMGKSYTLRGFTYLPTSTEPWVRDYVFLTSEDGQAWSPAAEGAFGNIENSPVLQTVPFTPRQARYFKFVVKADTKDRLRARAAEIGVLVEKR
jgi:alpha-L-fucosidase